MVHGKISMQRREEAKAQKEKKALSPERENDAKKIKPLKVVGLRLPILCGQVVSRKRTWD